MSRIVVFAGISPSCANRFETDPGGSATVAAPEVGADPTEKNAIFCGFPLSSKVKSSLVKPLAGPPLLLATTPTCTSFVAARNVGAGADSTAEVCDVPG